MAYGACLESRFTRKRIGGSNPPLSAKILLECTINLLCRLGLKQSDLVNFHLIIFFVEGR